MVAGTRCRICTVCDGGQEDRRGRGRAAGRSPGQAALNRALHPQRAGPGGLRPAAPVHGDPRPGWQGDRGERHLLAVRNRASRRTRSWGVGSGRRRGSSVSRRPRNAGGTGSPRCSAAAARSPASWNTPGRTGRRGWPPTRSPASRTTRAGWPVSSPRERTSPSGCGPRRRSRERGAVPRHVRKRGRRHRPQGRRDGRFPRQRDVLRDRRLHPRGVARRRLPGHHLPRGPGGQLRVRKA